jgi:hypothetical protein
VRSRRGKDEEEVDNAEEDGAGEDDAEGNEDLEEEAVVNDENGRDAEEPNSRIDFSIGLRLSCETKGGLSRCTNAVNPTLYEPVRFAPTAVHIETKLTGEGWRAAQSRLSLWVIRHVAKLRVRGSLTEL